MDFVDFNLAKKLKEKGFDEECLAYYTSEYTLYLNKVVLCDDKYLELAEIDYEECLRSYNTQKDRLLRTIIDAPTISQVLKWLREEKEIDIVIYPIDACTVFMGGEKYILSIYISRKREYKLHRDNKDKYVKWEEAAYAGIEYVLDNLI